MAYAAVRCAHLHPHQHLGLRHWSVACASHALEWRKRYLGAHSSQSEPSWHQESCCQSHHHLAMLECDERAWRTQVQCAVVC